MIATELHREQKACARRIGRLLWLLPLVALHPAAAAGRSGTMAEYGARTTFEKGKEVAFPDFTLVYQGERHVESPVFRPGFTFHDFVARAGSEEVRVSWSSGTGEIAPREFEVGGKVFSLELMASDRLGRLKRDELVIWLVR